MSDSPVVSELPKPVKSARVILWVQAGFNVLSALLVMAAASGAGPIDEATRSVLNFIMVIGFVSALVLAGLAFMIKSAQKWVAIVAIVVEALLIIDKLTSFGSGVNVAMLIVGMILPAVVIINLVNADSRRFFGLGG